VSVIIQSYSGEEICLYEVTHAVDLLRDLTFFTFQAEITGMKVKLVKLELLEADLLVGKTASTVEKNGGLHIERLLLC